jgi:YrbI family 3-deoxy-D-manno-octulosonate 8-phosphate phosphatase
MIKILFLDFDGVLTDNSVYVSSDGTEIVRCYRGDGIGLRQIQDAGISVCIISAEVNDVVKVRAAKLDIKHVHTSVANKLSVVRRVLTEFSIKPSQACFIGNDLPDIPSMSYVGLSACPIDAEREVLRVAKLVLPRKGGRGCVRDLCNHLLEL